MYKKVTALVVSFCLLAEAVPMNVFAQENTSEPISISASEDEISSDLLDIASITAVAPKSVNDMLSQYKFTSSTGHGFAAERGNNLADSIKGKNTKVVGDNNIKNGPDRMILNRDGSMVLIQDKYYSTARRSINACFDVESGAFRYIDGDGNPMIIEVPSDQYAEAVEIMKSKIREGCVPGVTDPEEANTIVKKGALSFKQAKNLAKAGTIESLTYDSIEGIVTASYAFGISTVINYAVNRMNGDNRKAAVIAAANDGIKPGGLVFCSAVIAGQLIKTGALKFFTPASETIVKFFGENFAKTLVRLSGQEVAIGASSQVLTKTAAKALRANLLFAAVTTIVFTAPDAIELFRGRISKKQFVKNFSVTAAAIISGTAGGFIGGAVGNLVVPGAGTVPGAFIGSLVFGA